MSGSRDFRFGVNFLARGTADEFLAQVRQSTGAHTPEQYAEQVYGDAVQEVAE